MNIGKTGSQQFGAIFPAKAVVKFFGGQDNAFIKSLNEPGDFSHVIFAVGAAYKEAVIFKNPSDFLTDLWNVITVKEDMIGDNPVKGFCFKGNFMGIKGFKSKARVIRTDGPAGIPEHSLGNI